VLKHFEKYLDNKLPFLKKSKVLIAISGGIDSTVLTFLTHGLKMDCTLAHCNFKLRASESDLDEIFVKKLGVFLNIPTITTSFDTQKYASENGISTQMAARDLRYNWFKKLLKEKEIDYVLTAHHKEDVLETFLINFTRGTGLDGLLGIPEINGAIIRPLLNFTREDISKYAKKNKIEWREDKSNQSTKYLRNKIRHTVIPILKELNPNLLKTFEKTQKNLHESHLLIDEYIGTLKKEILSQDKDGNTKISINKIKSLKHPKAHLYELLKPYGFKSWKDITSLIKAQTGKQLFSKSHRLIKNREEFLLSKINDGSKDINIIPIDIKSIDSPIQLTFKEVDLNEVFNSYSAYIDKNLLNNTLVLRKWEKGDYFYPIGMKGKKKLSKFFKDEKLSLLEKENTWLLCSGNEIVWVIGKRLDNRYKITKKTKSILKITYKNNV